MEFQHTEKGERIVFTSEEERQVVGAAYLEELARTAKGGDIVSDELQTLHCGFANVGKAPKATKMDYRVNDAVIGDLGRVVQQFVDDTPEAVRDIAQNFGPTYLNNHITARTELGLDAKAFMQDFNAATAVRAMGSVVPDDLRGV